MCWAISIIVLYKLVLGESVSTSNVSESTNAQARNLASIDVHIR